MQKVSNKAAITISLLGILSIFLLPFFKVAKNRILPGDDIYLFDLILNKNIVAILYLSSWLLLIVALYFNKLKKVAVVITIITILLLQLLTSSVNNASLASLSSYARITLASAYWLSYFLLLLVLVEITRVLNFSYTKKAFLIFLMIFLNILIIWQSNWNNIGVIKEYISNRSIFWLEVKNHILLFTVTILITIIVSSLLLFIIFSFKPLQNYIFTILNILQTIPSIALFGLLMAPLSALVSMYPHLKNYAIGGIGWTPALIGLVIYATLPLCRNAFEGITHVDENLKLSAKGMGMTRSQVFFNLTLPLALPIILTGLRSTMIITIGLVTVAKLIGFGGLGRFIFQGLGEQATDLILLGTIPIVFIAIGIDTMMAILINNISRKQKVQ